MATRTKPLTNQQLAAEIRRNLDDISITFPLAEIEARKVLSLGIPLADCLAYGLVQAVSPAGREHLEETHHALQVISQLMDTETYERISKVRAWTVMWDWTRAPAGVAFV